MGVKSGGGRPQAYKLASGEKVPGVTTIVNRFKESGGLIHWAWQQGMDGVDYRQKRDDAADAGHLTHSLIDDEVHGRPEQDLSGQNPENVKLALKARDAFRTWRDQVKLEIIETETPLVSELFKYGGTFDALARVNGKLRLLDWKTSNGVYGDYIAQVAAYRQLIHEHAEKYGGEQIDGAQLLRFGKEFADFHDHYYPSEVLDHGFRFFELCREAFDIDKIIKKMAA